MNVFIYKIRLVQLLSSPVVVTTHRLPMMGVGN